MDDFSSAIFYLELEKINSVYALKDLSNDIISKLNKLSKFYLNVIFKNYFNM